MCLSHWNCESRAPVTLNFRTGSTASAVNPPPPPPDSEEPAQPAEPSTTEQKAASAAKSALDVSQDEILLSWLNHGDNLKQQWAIWYMHNPEEWNEYKTSHQKQTGGTTATTTNANASTTTSAAPDTATAGAAADASKTAAAAAAQQNTYSQPNAQVCCSSLIASYHRVSVELYSYHRPVLVVRAVSTERARQVVVAVVLCFELPDSFRSAVAG